MALFLFCILFPLVFAILSVVLQPNSDTVWISSHDEWLGD